MPQTDSWRNRRLRNRHYRIYHEVYRIRACHLRNRHRI